METEFDERFLFVDIEFPKDLSGIKKMRVVDDLLDVECEEWQVEQEHNPIPVDKEQEGQETVHCRFRNDICVKSVAKVDRVDIITLEIAVHNCKEDL